jgi:hypothetical protein
MKATDINTISLKQLSEATDHILDEVCHRYIMASCTKALVDASSLSLLRLMEMYVTVLSSLCSLTILTFRHSRNIDSAFRSLSIHPSACISECNEKVRNNKTAREYVEIRNKISSLRSSYETALCRLWFCEKQLSSSEFNELICGDSEKLSLALREKIVNAAATLSAGSSDDFWADIGIPVSDEMLQTHYKLLDLANLASRPRVKDSPHQPQSQRSGNSSLHPAPHLPALPPESTETLEYESGADTPEVGLL